jgi:hypothetical protein
MDDTATYVEGGKTYYANDKDKHPLFNETWPTPDEPEQLIDPYRDNSQGGPVDPIEGICTDRPFRLIDTTDDTGLPGWTPTYGQAGAGGSFEYYDGDTLIVSVPEGDPVPALNGTEDTFTNWRGPSLGGPAGWNNPIGGGDHGRYYWKLI